MFCFGFLGLGSAASILQSEVAFPSPNINLLAGPHCRVDKNYIYFGCGVKVARELGLVVTLDYEFSGSSLIILFAHKHEL